MASPALRRTLWQIILERVTRSRDDLRRRFAPRDPTDTVGFSIAFIALAAKLAKADGQVTADEVSMFRAVFLIPPEEEANAARVYNLCRQETSGYQTYARQLKRIVGQGPRAEGILSDVLDGLFHIAMADGEFHAEEERFLRNVHGIFQLPEAAWRCYMARHVPDFWDPWQVLGLAPGADAEALRSAWRTAVKRNHPDLLVANGLPRDMVELANSRLADINRAYEVLSGSAVATG